MMKKWGTILLSLCLVAWMLFSMPQAEAAVLPRSSVAIVPIGFHGTDNTNTRKLLAEKATEFIGERLYKESKLTIKTLEEDLPALQEQGIPTEGNLDGDAIEKIGKLLDVDYVIYGNIVSFSHHAESAGAILVETDSQVVDADIVLKMADTRTGMIVSAGRGKGNSSTSSGGLVVPLVGVSSIANYTWDNYELTGQTVDTAILRASDNSVRNLLQPIQMLKKTK